MSHLFEEADPVMMHHYIDRLDAGIDNVRRADLCEWMHRVVDELDEARRERDALIGSQIRPIAVDEWYQLPGNVGYETRSFSAPPVPFWGTRGQAVAAVRKAAGLEPATEAPDAAERG